MENLGMFMEYFTLTVVLIIGGLYLRSWYPPIKPQYIAAMLLIAGSVLGHFWLNNIAYGFMIAGLVHYKDELVAEAMLVKDSFDDIKDGMKYES